MLKHASILAFVLLLYGCKPYNRIMLHSDSIFGFVFDFCDFFYIGSIIDSLGYENFNDSIVEPEDCFYVKKAYLGYNPSDSSETVVTVRPLLVGKDTVYIERLYSIDNRNDSILSIICRSGEYIQYPSAEPRDFITITWTIPKQDTTEVIIKLDDH